MKKLFVFLDIDGVLNDMTYWEKFKKKNPELSDLKIPYIPFNPKSLRNLKKMNDKLKKKNIKITIILNSSWGRYAENRHILKAKLNEYGIRYHYKTLYRNRYDNKKEAVIEWLKNYNNPKEYLIIDDFDLDFKDEHFVKTDMNSGFTNKKMYEALKKARKLWKTK
jgi:hypothetical protein